MNKTVVFACFAGIAIVGILGAVVLLIFRPDASAVFINLVIQLLTLSITAASIFYGFGRQSEKLEQIEKQTNGTLSTLQNENFELRRTLTAIATKE